jgi:hypothetical protein
MNEKLKALSPKSSQIKRDPNQSKGVLVRRERMLRPANLPAIKEVKHIIKLSRIRQSSHVYHCWS